VKDRRQSADDDELDVSLGQRANDVNECHRRRAASFEPRR
jgi:hypothetical protein